MAGESRRRRTTVSDELPAPEAVPIPIPRDETSAVLPVPVRRPARRRRRDTFVSRTEPLLLLASGDPLARHTLHLDLEREGFAVEEAPDGETAVTLLWRLRPDAVLLEAGASLGNGLATCAHMRAQLRGESTPILLLVGADDVEAMAGAAAVGATCFVTRPVHGRALAHQLRCILRQAVAHEQVRLSEERFREVVDRLDQVFLVTSEDGREIIYVSLAYEALTGRSCRSLREDPASYRAAIHPDHQQEVRAALLAAGRAEIGLDYRIVRADGQVRWVHERRYHIARQHGSAARRASLLEDVTERHLAEAEIRQLADFDGVTALPNRAHFRRGLARAITRAAQEDRLVAALFLDLDHFKHVNDTLGHSAGDQLLRQVAERLQRCVRATDAITQGSATDDTCRVARLGGDEFTVLLDDLVDLDGVTVVARRMLHALREPFRLGDREVRITGSIGAAVCPRDGTDVDTLLKCADVAMYRVKDDGRDGFLQYDGAPVPAQVWPPAQAVG
jgi:diguanylate cyclase (GGDEF)-like protein/PAS domain S-box-containing protein